MEDSLLFISNALKRRKLDGDPVTIKEGIFPCCKLWKQNDVAIQQNPWRISIHDITFRGGEVVPTSDESDRGMGSAADLVRII